MKPTKLVTQWGNVEIALKTEQLLFVKGDTDNAVFYGQGYGTACLRLWQLDLSRRVASGRLSEIMGEEALKTDIFQRRLGLLELAKRAENSDKIAEKGQWQATQYQHIQAYIAGINHAIKDMKIRPIECLLLHYQPEVFTITDSYLLGQLKYFINSAWQYELFHTRLANQVTASQHKQLLATFSQEGNQFPPLPLTDEGEFCPEAIDAFQDGLKGLQYLGLESPDIGSNVIAISGKRTKSGKPLLISDPHLGHVNPGFNLLCQLESKEGLSVMGSHFPGSPGIIVGRNAQAAWGMVGIMADNQDLYWGQIDLNKQQVKTAEGWVELTQRTHVIALTSGKHHTFTTYDFPQGQLMAEKEGYGLFLRWPSLDSPSGDITFYQLAKCRDWYTFRDALRNVKNSPMMVGYADIHGDIGLQSMGYIPKRHIDIGSLVLNLANPQHQWQGYVSFDDLPSEYNPENGYAIYANQYSESLFNGKPALSNRWHPPTRAQRIEALITQTNKHTVKTCCEIQDDKKDIFAQYALAFLLPFVPEDKILSSWNANTQHIAESLLFDFWIQSITEKLLSNVLDKHLCTHYIDFWPTHRWAVINILKNHLDDWQLNENDRAMLIHEAYTQALILSQKTRPPYVEFRHTIKKPLWLNRILTGRYRYQGGNRETIHATRQNADFLTQSQTAGNHVINVKPYTFGPGFKLISELSLKGECHYLINTPAKGTPFRWALNRTLKYWQAGTRQSTILSR